jgi:1-acyl-sn-glycerol-3-phosphate acyltransferase
MQWKRVGIVARSTLQMAVYVGSTIVWALLSMLAAPLPYRQRYWFITRWTHFNLWALERICRIQVEVQGVEHVPKGGGIVMSKHQSTWETLALQRWFSPQTWVLKRELLRLPLFGWAISLLNPVAIDRGSAAKALRQLIQQGAERLSEERWVVIFPEGTRTQPGQPGRYHIGGALLAERTGATVVPVAHNAGRCWGRGRFIKQPGVIRVRIGPPIETKGRKAAEIMRLVEEWIEGQMAVIDAE